MTDEAKVLVDGASIMVCQPREKVLANQEKAYQAGKRDGHAAAVAEIVAWLRYNFENIQVRDAAHQIRQVFGGRDD